MVNTYILVAIAMVAVIAFLVATSYYGLIDLGITDTGTYDEYSYVYEQINEEVDKAFAEGNKVVDDAYKGLIFIGINETEEEKTTIFNTICNLMVENDMSNSTFGNNISCFRPVKFNITDSKYDCICYNSTS